MVDDLNNRNSGMTRCINFYDDSLKNPSSPGDLARIERQLPALNLLAAALRTRLEQNEENEDAFDLACSIHKYLGKWYFNLTMEANVQVYGLQAIRVYLGYLRSGRWESRTADVWEKVKQCLARVNHADRNLACLECARLRIDQGYWRGPVVACTGGWFGDL